MHDGRMTSLRRLLSHLAFALCTFVAMGAALVVNVGAVQQVGEPCTGLSLMEDGMLNPIGLGSWGAGAAGFRMWDRVVAVNQQAVANGAQAVAAALRESVGAPLVYEVERGGERWSVAFPTRVFQASDLLRGHAGHALLGLVFVLVAVLLYFLRPATIEAWSFFLFFGALGVALCMIVDATLLWTLPPKGHVLMPFLGAFGFLLTTVVTGTLWRGSGALFDGKPEAGEEGAHDTLQLSQRMTGANIVAFVTSAALALSLEWSTTYRYSVFDKLLYAWLLLCTVSSFLLLAFSYWQGRSPRRRARLRQIIWAWPLGAGIPIANLFLSLALQVSELSLLWDVFLLLVPLATADAIVRHDLLQLNETARRLVGGLTIAVAMGTILGVMLWSSVQFLRLTDAPALVALAAILFSAATPMTHWLQKRVEALLHPVHYDASTLVAAFSARASTATHLRDVAAQLKQILEGSLAPLRLEVLRLDVQQQQLVPVLDGGAPRAVRPLHQQLLARAEAFVVGDDDVSIAVGDELKGIAVVVRLAVQNEAVGLLCMGEATNGRPYEAGDIAFLSSLASPLAAALVSTGSYETVERMNRELEQRVDERTAELAHKNQELALLNERKDELVAMISHDFRSPLTIIRQNVQTVLRDLAHLDKEDLRDFMRGVARQEERLTSLCTNLLDLAKLRQQGPFTQPVDLGDIGRSIVDGYQGKAHAQGIELRCEVRGPAVVAGDVTRLGQLLQNLVDNALKFTPRGGRIEVRLEAQQDRVCLGVEDTGVGVPADAVPRLFEPFFQVPRQSHAGVGSGLGLAIVKAVVDAHGGEVRVSSQENRGTNIEVLLPRYDTKRTLQLPTP
jgi:signal transduction histidine kinase